MPFIARLIGGGLLLNLIVIGIVALSLSQSRDRHRDRAATASMSFATDLEREISATVDKIDLVLLTVADEVARFKSSVDADPEELQALIVRQGSRLPELHGLRITDVQGDVSYGLGYTPGQHANLANRDYFVTLANRPDAGLVISQPLVSRVSGQWQIVLARRLERADGAFDGVVYATIAIQHFADRFAKVDVGRRGAIILRDAELRLIVRHLAVDPADGDTGTVTKSADLRAQARQPSGTYTGRGPVDDFERTTSFRRFAKYPLYVIVGLGTDDYLVGWHNETRIAVALLAAFLLATLMFSALVYRSWKRREAHVDALGVLERKFRTLLESSPDALLIADAGGIITMANRRAESMFGYAPQELIGRPMETLLPQRSRAPPGDSREATSAATGTSSDRDLWAVTKSGHQLPVGVSLSPIETEQGSMVAAAIRDMTDRHASARQIEFLAHHDALTGLPNRLVVQSRFDQAAAQAELSGCKVALLFLDLDKFKAINDSHGHSTGDAMLRAVADRLRECVRDVDTISRHGGDEFLIIFAQLADADAARTVVEKVVERFQRPCVADGHEILATSSLGVAVFPDDGRDFGTLLKKADVAMYQSKAAGRNTFRFFDEQMNVDAVEQLQMRNGLQLALARHEFVLHYQPQIDLTSSRVVGVEALIRWQHPELGLVPPGRFISVAEESGLIVPIGDWVLGEACRQAMEWQKAGLPKLSMAVNLSAAQFERGNVEAAVLGALGTSGLDHGFLELELTESILIKNVDSVLGVVARLKRLGVKLSIDDFGTGYSSLSYLKRFAFDKLKIDQSFIRDLTNDPGNAAIVRAVVQMADGLGVTTIAEGVENESVVECLRAIGCDEAQGYLFAKPMPASQCAAYLAEAAKRSAHTAWLSLQAQLAAPIAQVPVEHERQIAAGEVCATQC